MHEEYRISTTTKENTPCREVCMGEAEDLFSLNLFLNLHTVELRAGIESDTKEKIG